MTCAAVAVSNGRQDTRVGSSTGRFDVGTERLVTPPIQGRADELSVIGASVTAVAQGRGVCWSSRGAGLTTLRPKSLTGWFTSPAAGCPPSCPPAFGWKEVADVALNWLAAKGL